jgi:hypothetical protein
MSILETFYLMFESNSDDVKIGADEAKKVTDDLDKSIKSADDSSKKLGASFSSLIGKAAAGMAAVFSIGAVAGGIIGAAKYADGLTKSADLLGVNIAEYERWTRAVTLAGGSAEGFKSTLMGLNSNMQMIATTGNSRAKPFFDKLGISVFDANGKIKSAIDLMPELAAAMEGLSAAEIQGLGQKLGLDLGTIMLLQKGSKEIDKQLRLQKEIGTVYKRDAQAAEAYNDAVENTGFAFQVLYSRIAGAVLPALTQFYDLITVSVAFLSKHSTLVLSFFAALSAILGVIAIKSGIIGAIWGALTSPIVLTVAAVVALGAAIALVAEDFINFFNGAPSLVGKLTEAFGVSAQDIKDLFAGVFDFITQRFNWLVNKVKGIANWLGLADFPDMAAAQTAISNATSAPLAAQSSAAINASRYNTNSVVNINRVEVNTQATDAGGISESIGKSLERQMRQLSATYDDGIRG